MNNNTYNASEHRRNIVTPAERKAAEARKLALQKEEQAKISAEKQRADEAKRREIEARRRSSVKTSSKGTVPPMRTGAYSNVSTGTTANTSASPAQHTSAAKETTNDAKGHASKTALMNEKERYQYQQQQQLMMQQRQIEVLERQLRQEKERRNAASAQHRRITELEYRVKEQQIIRDNMIIKDAEKENPKENDIMKRKFIGICVIAILILANILAFASLTKKDVPDKETKPQSQTSSDSPSANNTPNNETGLNIPEIEPTVEKQTVAAKDYTNGILILVNGEYPYDFENEGTDIRDDQLVTVAKEIKDGSYKASNYKTYLNSETVKMLNLMMTDFYSYSKRDDVMVNSAHRTYEQQKEILDSKKKQLGDDQQIAQTPGNSEHHTGYAFDFSIYPKNENGSTFINIAEYTWIYENCHKYGFVLRYPEGKTAITGIEPESWHFRYVGIPHATYMYQKNRTLEEHLSDLTVYSENIPLTINISDTESYSVFHVEKGDADQVTFSVPKDTEYMISGDNASGFVVWYNNADIGMKGKIQPSAINDDETAISGNANVTSSNTAQD